MLASTPVSKQQFHDVPCFFLSGFGVDLANTCEQGSLNNMFDIQKDRLNPLQSTQCKRPKESEK